MKILIGYQGAPNDDAMPDDLKWACFPENVDALVISIADVFLPVGPEPKDPEYVVAMARKMRKPAEESLERAHVLAQKAAEKLTCHFPNWKITCEACADDPAWALIKKAEEWRADLIVIGSGHHPSRSRFLGGISQMVLIQSPCSVRIARIRPQQDISWLKILIGVDGTIYSEAIFHTLAGRSLPDGAQIRVVGVIDKKALASYQQMEIPRQVDRMVGALKENFPNNIAVDGVVKNGTPQKVLLAEADDWKADTIFLGSRELTRMKRFLVGGLSNAVAAKALCSVEIVRFPNTTPLSKL